MCSILRSIEFQRKRFDRTPLSPYQRRDFDVSELHDDTHEGTEKCLRTRVRNHAHTRLHTDSCTEIYTRTPGTDKKKQSNPPTCTESFASRSLGLASCFPCRHVAGFLQWCVRKNTSLIRYKRQPTRSHPSILPLLYNSALLLCPHATQRSHRDPKRSSAARLTRVCNCPRKAIAPTAQMGRSGSGTSLA